MMDEKFMKDIEKYVIKTNPKTKEITYKEDTPEEFKKEYKSFWMGKSD